MGSNSNKFRITFIQIYLFLLMKKIFLALVVLIASVYSGCKSSEKMVEMFNDPENVELRENLIFSFNEAMVPDSLLNQWDSTAYVDFSPKVRGKFRWETPSQLVFSPEQGFKPATQYQASVNKVVAQFAEDKSFSKAAFTFKTPTVRLLSTQVMWHQAGESSAKIQPKLYLRFNYAVNPKDVQSVLSVTSKGQKITTEAETASESNEIVFWLKDVNVTEEDVELNIELAANLKPVGGELGSEKAFRENGYLVSPLNLYVVDVQGEMIGTEGRVKVLLSQPVDVNTIKSFVKVKPAVEFHLQALDNGFEIVSSGFSADLSYTVTIEQGMKGTVGGTMKNSISELVEFGELEPSLSFVDNSAVYLAKNGSKNIEIEINSIEEVEITLYKIYENNIIPVRKSYYNPEYDYWDGEESLEYGDVVYKEKITTSKIPAQSGVRLLNFNFKEKLPNEQGLYYITIRDTKEYWNSVSKLISFSDIGLIAKSNKKQVHVFANSITSALPYNQVNILVYSRNNQIVGRGVTNSDGVAVIDIEEKNASGFEPAMVIAKTEDDFNYLLFNQTRVNTDRFEVGGKIVNTTGLDVFVYGPRDIYRPGETIQYAAIIRTPEWKVPENNTYILKWRYPNGKEMLTFRKNTQQEGMFDGIYQIPQSSVTGTYSLEIYSPTEVLLASKQYYVEEFMPDRIKLVMPAVPATINIGSKVDLPVTAQNLFGTPAANRNYETSTQVRFKSFRAEKYPNYNFSLKNLAVKVSETFNQGKTDENGKFTESFTAGNVYANNGVLEVNHFVTVFDETGRPLSRAVKFDVVSQNYFVGVGGYNYNYYPLNRTVEFPLIATSYKGDAVSGKVKVEVVKYEYRNILRRSGEYYRYESQEVQSIVETKNITVQGEQTKYSYKPTIAGRYALRVYAEGSNAFVEQVFYSYGSWGADRNSFSVSKEGTVDIELDKNNYKVGESIKALFKTPFDGKLLVTVENNQLVYQKLIDVTNQSASLDIPTGSSFLPNVYISATLIKAHTRSDLPLTTAVGYKNVTVEDDKKKIDVAIKAAEESRSKKKQRITIKAAPNAVVTIAVVDEGVNQITDFKAPDPYKYFYGKRALGVAAYNLYPFLFPEKYNILSSTGAGDDMMAKRANTMPAKRVEIMSYWSGVKVAGSGGEVDFDIDIPTFSGNLQIMAVAVKGDQFGAAQQDMKVVDPLVVSTALPRFMSPNDTVTMPVSITNTTQKAISASVEVEAHKDVKAIAISSEKVNIEAGKEAIVQYKLIAPSGIGVVNSTVKVKGAGETFEQKIEWSVRPTAPLQKRSGSGSVEGSQVKKVNFETASFIQSSVDVELVVSALPGVSLGKQLNYLLNYPYGCTEQTVSAAFPQLYYKDLVVYYQKPGNTQAAGMNVMGALSTIQKRQIYNGGVTLWEGNYSVEAHWFASVYAAHFMIEAQRAGYEINKKTLSGLLNYLDGQLRSKKRIDYRYNNGQIKKIAPKEIAYSLYVLALAKQPNRSIMNFYSENSELLSLDGKYLLSAAYALVGDKKGFQQILPKSFSGEVSEKATGGSFYSPIRDEAIALNALLDVDPANNQIPVMAQHVTQAIANSRWFTTQEAVFSVLAIGKMAKQANTQTVAGDVVVDGKTVASTKGETIKLKTVQVKGNNVEVKSTGTGKLYYSWVSEGIDAAGRFEEVDNYIKVRRKFYNRNGNINTSGVFRQNDLIVVELSIEKSYSDRIENVVITDLLPAGFEIENTRLQNLPDMTWVKATDYPLSEDFRDDRINLFVDLYKQKQVYYYLVRAVSPGVFQLGPVAADAMYNGEMHSYNGGGTITIQP